MVPILIEVDDAQASAAFALISKLLNRRKIAHSIQSKPQKCWRLKPYVVEISAVDQTTTEAALYEGLLLDEGQMVLKWNDGRHIVCDKSDFETNFEIGYVS